MVAEAPPIANDEILYRRVSVKSGWCVGGVLNNQAFAPNKRDVTGLSVFRANFRSIEDAAVGPSSDGYFVIELLAGELRRLEIVVEPKPDVAGSWDISHAELPQIRYETRASAEVLKLIEQLKALAADRQIHGPFPPRII